MATRWDCFHPWSAASDHDPSPPVSSDVSPGIPMRLITHRLPGLVLSDHEFSVPLDHMRPDSETITVFAREVVAAQREKDHLPWLIFFQGGPGSEAPRPDSKGGWI